MLLSPGAANLAASNTLTDPVNVPRQEDAMSANGNGVEGTQDPLYPKVAEEVSATRLYLGNLPRHASKAEVEAHFATHGAGKVIDVKLMNGFGFIEYDDPLDAQDIVPAFHGRQFMGERMIVQFARGTRPRDKFKEERAGPRPRRTPHRMQISGLPGDTSWQDLKDFARLSDLNVVYSETGRGGDARGSFVEFESAGDLRTAVEKLDGREFKGVRVTCLADTQSEGPGRDRQARSRSPRRPYPSHDYDRRGPPRGPPRGYSPHDSYRERSPPRREYYDDHPRYRSPPRHRGPPMEEYPPPRRYEDPYHRDYRPPPPPPIDPYHDNRPDPRDPYGRPPPRGFAPPRELSYREYDRPRGYW